MSCILPQLAIDFFSSTFALRTIFERTFVDDWTAAKITFLYYLCHLSSSAIFWRLLFFWLPYHTLLDLIHIHRNDFLAFYTSQRHFSFQFVDILCRRFEKEKHGFSWRHQDCGSFYCFDGEGEEEEE